MQAGKMPTTLGIVNAKIHGSKKQTMLGVLNARICGDHSSPQHLVLKIATVLYTAAQLSFQNIKCNLHFGFTFGVSSMNPVCAYCR